MRARKIAILIDGGFLLKRMPALVSSRRRDSAEKVAGLIKVACRRHVQTLTGAKEGSWVDFVYRTFFYDAVPYTGQGHHPLDNRQIDFGKSNTANFRLELFECLRRQRKVALRLGKVNREGDWSPPPAKVRRVLGTRDWIGGLDFSAIDGGGKLELTKDQVDEARRLQKNWAEIENHTVKLGLRQKGVDMRIGLDIASITLKKQADTIVLISGDSDFVPAAKLARREGIEFILDPLWQNINDDLFEHIDGLQSGLPKPKPKPKAARTATATFTG